MLCTKIVSDIQYKLLHNMFSPCSAKRRASDKDCMPKKLSGDGLNLRITIINEPRQNLTNSEDWTLVLSLILKQARALKTEKICASYSVVLIKAHSLLRK